MTRVTQSGGGGGGGGKEKSHLKAGLVGVNCCCCSSWERLLGCSPAWLQLLLLLLAVCTSIYWFSRAWVVTGWRANALQWRSSQAREAESWSIRFLCLHFLPKQLPVTWSALPKMEGALPQSCMVCRSALTLRKGRIYLASGGSSPT